MLATPSDVGSSLLSQFARLRCLRRGTRTTDLPSERIPKTLATCDSEYGSLTTWTRQCSLLPTSYSYLFRSSSTRPYLQGPFNTLASFTAKITVLTSLHSELVNSKVVTPSLNAPITRRHRSCKFMHKFRADGIYYNRVSIHPVYIPFPSVAVPLVNLSTLIIRHVEREPRVPDRSAITDDHMIRSAVGLEVMHTPSSRMPIEGISTRWEAWRGEVESGRYDHEMAVGCHTSALSEVANLSTSDAMNVIHRSLSRE